MKNNKFALSSYLSLGGSDGPGIRTVVFLQGCPLRCDYCHNPETWDFTEVDTDIVELAQRISRNKPYFGDKGGVTVSGGEPLCQQDAVIEFFKLLKADGIHTCLDTSAGVKISKELLKYTDLILCDIKFMSDLEYKHYTGLEILDNVKDLLNRTKEENVPVWIRHVLYPDVTDNEEYVLKIKDFCADFPNIERIELLPFKNICQTKYDNLGMVFKMENTKLTPSATVEKLKELVK